MDSVLYNHAIEDAVRAFKNHKASYRRGYLFDTLDWRRPNELQYYIRMVFDHEREDTKAVYITGDMGEAVVYPTCEATLEGMAKCFTSPWSKKTGTIDINEDYFIEKIKASSNLWEWNHGLFEEDLRRGFRRYYGNDERMTSELNEFLEEHFHSYFADIRVEDCGVEMDQDARDAWEALVPDGGHWIYDCGKRLSNRIVFWLVAMRLAYEQIVPEERR